MYRFAISCVLATVAFAAPEEDRMGTLPGAEAFDTPTYSGYLKATETKSLHYVFAQSLNDPATDPVVFWFNGGPGCSSMLGFMQEHGPRIIDDGENYIKNNPEPWIKRANVVYLESPAGVGWSLGLTEEDMKTNDMITSQDALRAVHSWYEKFPEFGTNSLYLSGESYAGVYVPYLAWQIYENNLQAEFKDDVAKIPLAGFMVGNAVTDWRLDTYSAQAATGVHFNILPLELANQWNDLGCAFTNPWDGLNLNKEECRPLALEGLKLTSKLNVYDWYRKNYELDAPLASEFDRVGEVMVGGQKKTYRRGHTVHEYTPFVKHLVDESDLRVMAHTLADYMNMPETRSAFNIPDEAQAWSDCTGDVDYHIQAEASMWIYPVLRNKMRIMVYSGDTDGCVPTYGTKRDIGELGWPITEAWRPWYTDGQVSGYFERRDGLDFMTVKGVGHMAPQWARKPVTTAMMAWLHDEAF